MSDDRFTTRSDDPPDEPEPDVTYLGDGLYASYDGDQVKLMANSHKRPTDTVYLDRHVLAAFLEYANKIREPK